MTYNPPLRKSTLMIATYGVPADVLDQYVADRVRDMTQEILERRGRVSYQSVNNWADRLERIYSYEGSQ